MEYCVAAVTHARVINYWQQTIEEACVAFKETWDEGRKADF